MSPLCDTLYSIYLFRALEEICLSISRNGLFEKIRLPDLRQIFESEDLVVGSEVIDLSKLHGIVDHYCSHTLASSSDAPTSEQFYLDIVGHTKEYLCREMRYQRVNIRFMNTYEDFICEVPPFMLTGGIKPYVEQCVKDVFEDSLSKDWFCIPAMPGEFVTLVFDPSQNAIVKKDALAERIINPPAEASNVIPLFKDYLPF